MAILRATVVCGLIAAAGLSLAAFASRSTYILHSASTAFWDQDVSYFAPPIRLNRTNTTWDSHSLEFDVLRYQAYCASWEKFCVAYNQQGQCIRWEDRCVRWDYQTFRIPKRIYLDFRSLPDLAEKEIEVYEIQINRQKPVGNGDDWVTTWFSSIKTKIPVRVRKFSDENYSIEPKPVQP